MNKPGIVTAIPKSRYKFGEFTVTVLGDVESNDGIEYRHILAVIRGSDPEPGLYITAERSAPAQSKGGDYTMRIVMHDGDGIIGASDAWGERDAFVREALAIVSKVLNLSDEVPYQLM
jgi:hypothetical protein